MSSRLRHVLTALTAPVVLLAAVVVPAGGAGAATMVRECKVTGTSCVRFTGYAGKPVWGYPVSSRGTNCVNYVAYRLSRNGVRQQSTLGNGGSWALERPSTRSIRLRVRASPALACSGCGAQLSLRLTARAGSQGASAG